MEASRLAPTPKPITISGSSRTRSDCSGMRSGCSGERKYTIPTGVAFPDLSRGSSSSSSSLYLELWVAIARFYCYGSSHSPGLKSGTFERAAPTAADPKEKLPSGSVGSCIGAPERWSGALLSMVSYGALPRASEFTIRSKLRALGGRSIKIDCSAPGRVSNRLEDRLGFSKRLWSAPETPKVHNVLWPLQGGLRDTSGCTIAQARAT